MKNAFYRVLLVLTVVTILAAACKPFRFIAYNTADIKDYKKFAKREIANSAVPFTFPASKGPRFPKKMNYGNKGEQTFEEFLEKNKTVAFLIIKNDSVHYENYFSGYDSSSIVPSFSVGKSVTSILVGFAVQDGLIKSVNEPVTSYVEGLRPGFEKITIENLLQMTSGIRYNESYWNPFGHAASFYYGRNLHRECRKLKMKEAAGKHFEYKSGDTQLLGLVLESALKGKTIAQYAMETPANGIWRQLEYR